VLEQRTYGRFREQLYFSPSAGHTCLSLGKVIHFLCSRHRGMTEAEVTSAMDQLSQRGDIGCRNGMISLPHVAKAEETITHRLKYIGSRLRRIRPRRLAKLMCAVLSTYTATVRLNPIGMEDNGK
jgi:hypothetical protein